MTSIGTTIPIDEENITDLPLTGLSMIIVSIAGRIWRSMVPKKRGVNDRN